MNEPPKDTTLDDELERIWKRPRSEEDAELRKAIGLDGPKLRVYRSGSKIFIEAGQPRLVINAAQAREIAAVLVQLATEVETR